MFKPRHILPAHTQRLNAVEDAADTTITVNHGGGGVPPRPNFNAAPRPASTTTTTTRRTSAPSVPAAGNAVTETHRQINWGGVLKGVAVVAGVVLVAAVAYAVVPTLLTSWGLIGSEGVITGVVEAIGPTVSNAATDVYKVMFDAAHYTEVFVSRAFTDLGGTAAVEAVTKTASVATTNAVHAATAALAGGGALALGVPLAVKTMLSTPTTELVTQTHIEPAASGLTQGDTTTTQQTTTRQHGTHENLLNELPEVPDMHGEAANSMKAASKMAHHAAHHAEHVPAHSPRADVSTAPEHSSMAEKYSREALRKTAQLNEAWADRVGRRELQGVAPRSSKFSEQLHHDRTELESALHSPSV